MISYFYKYTKKPPHLCIIIYILVSEHTLCIFFLGKNTVNPLVVYCSCGSPPYTILPDSKPPRTFKWWHFAPLNGSSRWPLMWFFSKFGSNLKAYKLFIIEYYYHIHNLCCMIFPTICVSHHLDMNRIRYNLVKMALWDLLF